MKNRIINFIKIILPEALMITGGMLLTTGTIKSLLGIVCIYLGIIINRQNKF